MLTNLQPAVPKGEPYRFTAKPVPKVILQKPIGVGKKPEIPVTVPQSPAITKSTRHVKPVRFLSVSVTLPKLYFKYIKPPLLFK